MDVKSQGICDRCDDLRRWPHITTLFEPRLPTDAYVGKLGYLLLAKARHSPAGTGASPDCRGIHSGSARTQEGGEGISSHAAVVLVHSHMVAQGASETVGLHPMMVPPWQAARRRRTLAS